MGIKRKLKDAEGSYFLFGPRGTGKTIWLDENLSDAIRISLLDAAIERELRSYPERLENYIGGAKDKMVVIDEVQRAPSGIGDWRNIPAGGGFATWHDTLGSLS